MLENMVWWMIAGSRACGVFGAELDDVPGVFIAEHALVLRREAPGGDDIEEKNFEDIERTGEVHHGVEFAVPYVLLVA